MSACSWTVLNCGCEKLESLDPAVRAEVEAMAVDRLWRWTGERFGSCPITVRPCRRKCWEGDWWPFWPVITRGSAPLLDDVDVPLTTDGGSLLTDDSHGAVFGSHCGLCRGECGCTHVSEVLLPGPASEIIEVMLDGEVLDPTTYRVDDWARLVRLDGEWPWCQDLNAPDDGLGAWAVTYTRGEPLPPGAGLVAGSLACELAKAFCGDSSCRLPKRANQIVRQGITIAITDDYQNLQAGQSGIWEVDDWVATQMANKTESVVYSPDLQQVRRTTWIASSSS